MTRADAALPLRYLDVALVVALAPAALLLGVPAFGYLVGAAAWIVQRVLGAWLERKSATAADPKRAVTIRLAGSLMRAWSAGLAILAVGLLGQREDGLTAAVVVLVAFTVYLALTFTFRPNRAPA